MPQIKVILVEIHNPKDYKGSLIITSDGIREFLGSDGKVHALKSANGISLNSFGKLYQMVGYDPSALEENQFLPIAEPQWRYCTKFIPRDSNNRLLAGLNCPEKRLPREQTWQYAILKDGSYELFQFVSQH